MKKVFQKIIASFLIAFGSILLWIILIAVTPNNGPRTWTAWSVVGGFGAIIYIWTTGWGNKKEETPIIKEEQKDLFKLD